MSRKDKRFLDYEQWLILKHMDNFLKNYTDKEIAKFMRVSKSAVNNWRRQAIKEHK